MVLIIKRVRNRRGIRFTETIATVLFCLALLANLLIYFWARENLIFGAQTVAVTSNVSEIYYAPGNHSSSYFSSDNLLDLPDTETSIFFRQETEAILKGASGDFDRALRLREWVRSQCVKLGATVEQLNIHDPIGIVEAMREGKAAQCGPLARVLVAALLAHKIPARMVILFRSAPLRARTDGHAVVEAYVGGKWVLFDPMFDVHWTVYGKPAGVWEVRDALLHSPEPEQPKMVPGKYTAQSLSKGWQGNLMKLVFNHVVYVAAFDLPSYRRYIPFHRPFLKNYVTLVQPMSRSPFALANWVAWTVHFWIPLLLVCLLFLLAMEVIKKKLPVSQTSTS